jgi:hypothetical protein
MNCFNRCGFTLQRCRAILETTACNAVKLMSIVPQDDADCAQSSFASCGTSLRIICLPSIRSASGSPDSADRRSATGTTSLTSTIGTQYIWQQHRRAAQEHTGGTTRDSGWHRTDGTQRSKAGRQAEICNMMCCRMLEAEQAVLSKSALSTADCAAAKHHNSSTACIQMRPAKRC